MAKEDLEMSLTLEPTEFEVVEETPFFAPVPSDLLDSLMGQYRSSRRNVESLADLMNGGELSSVVHYFIDGNCGDEKTHRSLYVDRLFGREGALQALGSAFWSKALALTDVYECMPQERKNQWHEQLRNPAGIKQHPSHYDRHHAEQEGRPVPEWTWKTEPLPEFEEATVRATIAGLLHARSQFLAERVDGIFRNLSGEHVTNAPEAFGKRMIVAHVLTSYGTVNHEKGGYLHDLRCVIARFMGREEPKNWGTTDSLISRAKHERGQWVTADGGALRIRVYKIGTAHLEVHPEMAYRLNQILAYLHPTAIPAQFRQKPKRPSKTWAAMGRPLPFAVVELLSRMRHGLDYPKGATPGFHDRAQTVPLSRQFDHGDHDKAALDEATRVIESIGGVKEPTRGRYFMFDYEAADVIGEIVASGCVPDRTSHQYFPTPEAVGTVAVQMADIGPTHTVGEFSAGQGALAALLPKDRTVCVELSALHCAVLKAKGFRTIQADFLEWSKGAPPVDRAVINPPFSDGRWRAHTEAAASLIAPGGKLVAILPASAPNSLTELPGFALEWSRTFSNEFAGTSVSVVILAATRT